MPNQSDPNNQQGVAPVVPTSPTVPPPQPETISDTPVFLDPAASPPAEPAVADTPNRPTFLTVEETPATADTPISNTDNLAANVSGETIQSPPGGNDAPPPTSFVVTPAPPPGGGNGKKVAALMGIVGLVAATIIGVAAVGSSRLQPSSAWDCNQYTFNVSKAGLVTVVNGSSRNEPIQKAQVQINGSLVQTFDVPALSSGQSATLGTVAVPGDTFTWDVTGTIECQDGGSYQGTASSTPTGTPIAQCGAIKAYDTNWDELNSAELSSLKAGDKVRFAVAGITLAGTIDKVRFTVNGTQRPEVTIKKPGTDEFYDEYTIPAGTTTFNLSAQVHHQESNDWY